MTHPMFFKSAFPRVRKQPAVNSALKSTFQTGSLHVTFYLHWKAETLPSWVIWFFFLKKSTNTWQNMLTLGNFALNFYFLGEWELRKTNIKRKPFKKYHKKMEYQKLLYIKQVFDSFKNCILLFSFGTDLQESILKAK